ncbi:hypothetical protein ABT336_09450 [Micromonospora sp. NPDC000207]|uniref:hypothetical protein n=1 Tax=Micromonospora sp. NPDC000207 TaxID=3154246 RepID=UPI00331F1D17
MSHLDAQLPNDETRHDGAPYDEVSVDAEAVGEPQTGSLLAFGLRTAALAGLVVPVGLLVGRLVAGDAGDAVASPLTTCCPTVPM